MFIALLISTFFFSCDKKEEKKETINFKLIKEDSLKLHFPEDRPIQAGEVFRLKNGFFLYLVKSAPNDILVFNDKGRFLKTFGGLGNEPEKFPFFPTTIVEADSGMMVFTGALMHLIKTDASQNIIEKIMVTDSLGNYIFREYRIANHAYTGFWDSSHQIALLPIENNVDDPYTDEFYKTKTIGIIDKNGIMTKSFGEFESIYPTIKYLPQNHRPSLAYDDKNKEIYITHSGSSEIQVYNLQGKKLKTIDHQGNSITDHTLRGIHKGEESGLWTKYWNEQFSYNHLFFDNSRNRLYRIYSEDTDKESATRMEHIYEKKAYFETFHDGKFLGEILLPSNLAWRIIAIDSKGTIYFKTKYTWQNEDSLEIYIYKYNLEEE